jgi:PEP-CTERM motif
MKSCALFIAGLFAAASGAQALTIDFGNGPAAPSICTSAPDGTGALVPCGNYGYISQSYGDVAGIADISYSAPRVAAPTSLYWWASNYNNLFGVAFAPSTDANSRARIEIKAVNPGDAVTLASFALGAYSQTTLNTTVNVFAIGGTVPLFNYSGPVGNGAISATTLMPNISVPGGLWLEFQDSAWNVGIDNIQYSVSAVPEPASALLMLAGVAGLLAARRRAA